ncbi:hypothetical protein E5D91_07065 [Helicobacter pylori]|nr:hypothetical protein E5D91_07065 [Helicobacter pylori]
MKNALKRLVELKIFLSGTLNFLNLKVFLNIIIKQALNLSLEPTTTQTQIF